MLDLFVLNAEYDERVLVYVIKATKREIALTKDWQTSWTAPFAGHLPNKVALRRADDQELLGLMSYELDEKGLAETVCRKQYDPEI